MECYAAQKYRAADALARPIGKDSLALLRSEKYKGQETEVFAFFASPKTLGLANGETRFPGVVLIHGGGGTALPNGPGCGPSAVMPP